MLITVFLDIERKRKCVVDDLAMDYEEISDVLRCRVSSAGMYVDGHYESVHGNDSTITAGNGAPSSQAVNHAAGLSPSTTVRHVEPPLYSKVVRRCFLAKLTCCRCQQLMDNNI